MIVGIFMGTQLCSSCVHVCCGNVKILTMFYSVLKLFSIILAIITRRDVEFLIWAILISIQLCGDAVIQVTPKRRLFQFFFLYE